MKEFGNDKVHLCKAGKNKANGDDVSCPEGMNKKESLGQKKENKIVRGW